MTDFPVDVVVTYVDDQDPVWRGAAAPYVRLNKKSSRWNSLGLFKYWLRGVARYMPWANAVHMVVSNPEQVPECVDREKVHVVLHREIIPESLLPTFNSTTIEMFLCRIPGLAERFVYSNDDMFAVGPLRVDDFFDGGVPLYDMRRKDSADSLFRRQCRNSYKLAARLAGADETAEETAGEYFAPAHSMTPMLRSVCEEVHAKAGAEIEDRCTRTRTPSNYTQYLFPDYALMTKRARNRPWPHFRYFGESPSGGFSPERLRAMWCKIACVNGEVDQQVDGAFDRMFHEKSRFER